MTQPILVLGARTLSEDIADRISEIPGFEVVGFVENMDPERCKDSIDGLPILWVDELAAMAGTHLAVCGLATTQRKRYVDQVAALGMRFATLVHPSASVSAKSSLGGGCFVSAAACIGAKTELGKQVFVNRGALIGHHTRIGDYVTIQPGANIAGMVTVGEGTYIAMGAVILDRLTIGRDCVIGAGSVVTKDVPDRVQVVGVPARIVKTDIEGR